MTDEPIVPDEPTVPDAPSEPPSPSGVPPWARGGTARPAVPAPPSGPTAPGSPFAVPTAPGSPFAVPAAVPPTAVGAPGPSGPAATPSTVTADQLTVGAAWATAARPSASPAREYAQFATSPLWWLLASVGLWLGSLFVWLFTVGAVLSTADGEGISDAASAGLGVGGVVAIVLAIAGWIASLIWVYTIGQNAGTFGAGLMLLTMFPVYLWVLIFAGPIPLFLGLLLWALFPYRMLITGIWTAGRLPRAVAAVGWGPIVLGYGCTFAAVVIESKSEVRYSSSGFSSDAAAALWVGGSLLILLGGVVFFGFLITVTVVQHVGIGRDRQRRAEASAARRYQQGMA